MNENGLAYSRLTLPSTNYCASLTAKLKFRTNMKAELLSVDFVHPDCDETQMVIHVRCPIGGVVGGPVEVRWPDREPPNLRDTLTAMTVALTGTEDIDEQERLFNLAGRKPSHYCDLIRRDLLAYIRLASERTWPDSRRIEFTCKLLGVAMPEIGER